MARLSGNAHLSCWITIGVNSNLACHRNTFCSSLAICVGHFEGERFANMLLCKLKTLTGCPCNGCITIKPLIRKAPKPVFISKCRHICRECASLLHFARQNNCACRCIILVYNRHCEGFRKGLTPFILCNHCCGITGLCFMVGSGFQKQVIIDDLKRLCTLCRKGQRHSLTRWISIDI